MMITIMSAVISTPFFVFANHLLSLDSSPDCLVIGKIDRFNFNETICQEFDSVDSSSLSSMERHRLELDRLTGLGESYRIAY